MDQVTQVSGPMLSCGSQTFPIPFESDGSGGYMLFPHRRDSSPGSTLSTPAIDLNDFHENFYLSLNGWDKE